MPSPSKVAQLPSAVRAWLDDAVREGNFAGYDQLVAALKARGFDISRSALQRHGQAMKRRLEAVRASTDAARLIAEAAPDEADQRSAAVISLVQTDIFNVLMLLQEAETAEPEDRLKIMGQAARAVADLARASVGQKKHEREVEVRRQMAAKVVAQAEAAEAAGQPMSAERLRAIMRDTYGV